MSEPLRDFKEVRTIENMLKVFAKANEVNPAPPGQYDRVTQEALNFIRDYVAAGKGTEAEAIEEVMKMFLQTFTQPHIIDGQHKGH